MPDHPLHALHDAFADLVDPRVDRTKDQRLLAIVSVALGAVICGADSWGQGKPGTPGDCGHVPLCRG